MPKNSNKRRVYTTSEKPSFKDRLRHRKSAQEQELDNRRSHLIAEILNASTLLSIDESSNSTSARHVAQEHGQLLDLIDELREVESTINPRPPHRNDEAWRKFFEWIDRENKQSDGNEVLLSSNITVGAVDTTTNDNSQNGGDEYSLLTQVPLKRDQKVFSVTRSLMLTTETAIRDSDLEDFIRNDMIASGMQNVVLVLHLLNEFSKGERSHWWPYLSILPCKLLPILRLTKTKLSQHLLASAHIFEALKMLRAIVRQYSYFYKRLQATKLPLKKDFTFQYYAWGVSIVCSRQNEIPSQRTRNRDHQSPVVHALIPLLDMCNHNLHSNQPIFSDDSSCLTASSDLEIGQEITINYGCRSSGDFYIHNGFVPDEVPADFVPLTIALSGDHLLELKTKLLKILNMPKTIGRFKLICN